MLTPGRSPRLAILLVLLLVGCSDRPRAPLLGNEAVYNDEKIGLRFLAPDGWAIASRTSLPPGELTKPVMLVAYRHRGEMLAEFELLTVDLPESEDLGRFLAEHRIGPVKWAFRKSPESVTIGGLAASRFTMSRGSGKDQEFREATAVRREGRVYFFVVTFGALDADSRDQVHKSVESVTWTK